MEEKNYFKLGMIVNTHGIRGEVKVKAITDFAQERFAKGQIVYLKLDNQYQALTVQTSRLHKGMWLLSFKDYQNINLVEAFKGQNLYVHASQREELPAGEYYYDQIIGCQVVDLAGNRVGEITEILSPGANDVWTVARPNAKDGLIPVIDDVVKEVDVANRKIVIDVLEGLFD